MPFRIKHNSMISEELLQEINHYIETYCDDESSDWQE
ncbi:MAG: hypothetical protein H6Q59_2881 [Firmicutes bacterium]|nr:hypothetical protein [Bacillota bacterium]